MGGGGGVMEGTAARVCVEGRRVCVCRASKAGVCPTDAPLVSFYVFNTKKRIDKTTTRRRDNNPVIYIRAPPPPPY